MIRRVGRRGASLIFFGLLDIIYSISLIAPDEESRNGAFLRGVASVAPLWCWAVLWGVTGLILLAQAPARNDRVGFTAAIFLKVTWAVTCILAWLVYGAPRGYVSAAIWLAAAGFVWVISGWPESEGRAPWTLRSSSPSSPESRD